MTTCPIRRYNKMPVIDVEEKIFFNNPDTNSIATRNPRFNTNNKNTLIKRRVTNAILRFMATITPCVCASTRQIFA
jgi:hypothetical protein